MSRHQKSMLLDQTVMVRIMLINKVTDFYFDSQVKQISLLTF